MLNKIINHWQHKAIKKWNYYYFFLLFYTIGSEEKTFHLFHLLFFSIWFCSTHLENFYFSRIVKSTHSLHIPPSFGRMSAKIWRYGMFLMPLFNVAYDLLIIRITTQNTILLHPLFFHFLFFFVAMWKKRFGVGWNRSQSNCKQV